METCDIDGEYEDRYSGIHYWHCEELPVAVCCDEYLCEKHIDEHMLAHDEGFYPRYLKNIYTVRDNMVIGRREDTEAEFVIVEDVSVRVAASFAELLNRGMV